MLDECYVILRDKIVIIIIRLCDDRGEFNEDHV